MKAITVLNKTGKIWLLACAVLISAYSGAAYSQEDVQEFSAARQSRTIAVIKVSGNKAVSSATVLSKIKSKPGDEFSQELLNGDIKRLYNTGFFTDVEIEVEDYKTGMAVTFAVTEKPVIESITFAGNRHMRPERLKKIMKTAENEMLSEVKLNKDLNEIRDAYKKSGFQLVDIAYSYDLDKEKNSAKIKITIDEKTRIKIRKVIFDGNYSFSRGALIKNISTRPDSLFTSGYFKEEVFKVDLEKLKSFYERKGFLDIDISHRLDYDESGRWMDICLEIKEGKKYMVGNISIEGNAVFPESELKSTLEMTGGLAFSNTALRMDIMKLQQFY
ncbi:MAG: POTRA domain-containing protein, partial [Candidatus Omnitrophota bacterium]